MEKSLAMIEYSTVSSGMAAADLLSKTSELQFLKAKTVCPGKFIVLFCGELAALQAAIDAVRASSRDKMIDSFILGNPHESIIGVLENEGQSWTTDNSQNDVQEKDNKSLAVTTDIKIDIKTDIKIDTLGIIETQTSASAIRAADISVKAAKVRLLEIRLAKSMCGKAYVLFTGTIASVWESVNTVVKQIGDTDVILDFAVIPTPDPKFIESLEFD